ncbi:hypothetical protein DES34_102210 [Brevibacillus brevis]|nr:hypothetical protein DES34_102210 [Brevibacillus brevis]TQK62768.1 hypothetical protein FB479_10481 [Brevibacillus sp. AG162]VEF92385.1 Uncharacterised protein [Brevibacillus brevis]
MATAQGSQIFPGLSPFSFISGARLANSCNIPLICSTNKAGAFLGEPESNGGWGSYSKINWKFGGLQPGTTRISAEVNSEKL